MVDDAIVKLPNLVSISIPHCGRIYSAHRDLSADRGTEIHLILGRAGEGKTQTMRLQHRNSRLCQSTADFNTNIVCVQ